MFFNGDPEKWKKFGNSLKLRILNRCAGTPWSFTYAMVGTGPFTTTAGAIAYTNADAEIAAILSDPSEHPILSGHDDNVQLFYPGGPYMQPIYAVIDRTHSIISETMVDWLEARGDPRLHIFAQPTAKYVDGNSSDPYVGEQNGAPYVCANEPTISFLGLHIGYDESAPLYIFTYDEIEFIKAEHYLRQGDDVAARNAYEEGIAASMIRWGCLDGETISPSYMNWAREVFTLPDTQNIDYATYLAHPLVDWNAAANNGEKYQHIIEHKWAASFTQGWQAWHEARRTGFPARIFEYEFMGTYFPDLGMPVRIRINEEEALLNAENFEKAQKRQNIEETNYGLFSTDGIKSQMWWHTRKNPIPKEVDPPAK